MKKLKFIVEQGGETKAGDVEYGVIQVRDRLYRHPRGKLPPIEARHLWFASFRPSGWESFPIWPGTEPDVVEVRARLEVDSRGCLVLCMNGEVTATLASSSDGCLGISGMIVSRLQEIREGKL